MTEKELYKALKALKIPVAYRQFNHTVELPYLVYYIDSDSRYGGDDSENLIQNKNIIIELYTAKKDLTLENKIHKILTNFDHTVNEYTVDNTLMTVFEYGTTNKLEV